MKPIQNILETDFSSGDKYLTFPDQTFRLSSKKAKYSTEYGTPPAYRNTKCGVNAIMANDPHFFVQILAPWSQV